MRQRQSKNPSSAPSVAGPVATAGSPGRAGLTRVRVLLVAFPLLLAWWAIVTRRGTARPLPNPVAICSRPGARQIRTLSASNASVECIVVENGLIAAAGTLNAVRRDWGDLDRIGRRHHQKGGGIKIVYLKLGATMLPGLIDAHAHVLQYGESVGSANLVGAKSVDEVIERLVSFVNFDPLLREDRSRFVLGLGWDQTIWPGGCFPTAADLDRHPRLKGRPIYLKRIDVHALWVSPSIISKIRTLPNSVPGGLIVRTPSGAPSGVFVDNAMTLVLEVVPPWTDVYRLRFLTATAREMLQRGLTSVHDASLTLTDIAFLKRIDQAGRLPIRIYGMVSCEPLNTFCGDEVERYDGDRFVVRAVKLFTDGALGSWGAAMEAPYSDNVKERGIMISEEEVFAPLIKQGFQVASHAIGDRANRVVLDAYEAAVPAGLDPLELDLRPRIEHAQIMSAKDIVRMGRLGVIASIQPTHATSDMAYAEARIGPERIKGAYAWSSLIGNGSRVALGSDFPVEKPNPLLGIYAAITRRRLDGTSPHGEGGWYPAERLTLDQALRGFTLDAAWASFQEHRVGSLEVGKEADFVVLDRDLAVVDELDIPHLKVMSTVVGGRLFHGKLQ